MRFGLAKTCHEELTQSLRETFFSLNIDESTSNNLQRVLCILASYYCPRQKEVVVKHLASISVVKVNSESLYTELVEIIEKNQLPWQNLMSVLMDSCNVMRGSKSGVETRLREKASHLLDIDGDSCHHAHNASKVFCKPFNSWVEQLLNSLYNDFKWSADLREALMEICTLIGVKYTMPERYVSHRWLSVYDVTVDVLRLWDALLIFYFAFLAIEDRQHYLPRLVEIYQRKQLSGQAKEKIRGIHDTLKKKTMTKDGQRRKTLVIERLFIKKKKTKLIMDTYSTVLPLLKKYVLMFEMKEPMVHLLNDKQVELVREFLSCFIKVDHLSRISDRKLCELNLREKSVLLSHRNMLMGSNTSKMVLSDTKKSDPVIVDFLATLREAYVSCGEYLQKKMPINNTLLKSLSSIDPIVKGREQALQLMRKFPRIAPNVLTEEELVEFDLEVRKYHIDVQLPEPVVGGRIDTWWTFVFQSGKYPLLSRMVKAFLSCFHGPQVESSFSTMGDIIDSKSQRLNIESYSAIQSVKYSIRASTAKNACELFRKDDHLHDVIDGKLCSNMKTSYKSYREELEMASAVKESIKQKYLVKSKAQVTKRKAKEISAQAAKKARMYHQAAQLEKLRQQKK